MTVYNCILCGEPQGDLENSCGINTESDLDPRLRAVGSLYIHDSCVLRMLRECDQLPIPDEGNDASEITIVGMDEDFRSAVAASDAFLGERTFLVDDIDSALNGTTVVRSQLVAYGYEFVVILYKNEQHHVRVKLRESRSPGLDGE